MIPSLLFAASAVGLVLVAWSTSCYYLYLSALAPLPETPPSDDDEALPPVTVIVPCYQEADHILEKLRNTEALQYPQGRLQVLVVDGGSVDGTADGAREFCDERANFLFLSSSSPGKILQLNQALAKVDEGVVVVSDVDGELEAGALVTMVRSYSDERVGCVGAFVEQRAPLAEDAHFWRDQNAMRLLESSRGHSSVVVAVAYSFRRSLFDKFPGDVVADDVYVAFRCNTAGLRSVYSTGARAFEVRSGSGRGQMFRHKLRKLNANMRELVRFLPEVGTMAPLWRTMFLSKFVQSWLLAPTLVFLAVAFVGTAVVQGTGCLFFWGPWLVVLAVLQWSAGRRLSAFAVGDGGGAGCSSRGTYVLLFLSVLVVGFVRYFMVRQTSSYRKVS